MTKLELRRKIAILESVNDHLMTDIAHLDRQMRLIGFSQGLITVKATAQEIIDKGLSIGQA